jgi:hypothetical protein
MSSAFRVSEVAGIFRAVKSGLARAVEVARERVEVSPCFPRPRCPAVAFSPSVTGTDAIAASFGAVLQRSLRPVIRDHLAQRRPGERFGFKPDRKVTLTGEVSDCFGGMYEYWILSIEPRYWMELSTADICAFRCRKPIPALLRGVTDRNFNFLS